MAAAGFPHSLSPCLPAQYAEERATIGGPGGSTPNRRNRRSLQGTDSAIPAPTAILKQMSPQVATPGDISSFIAPAYHAKDTRGCKHVHIPPLVVPNALLDKLLPLQERMNTALE